MESEAEMTVTPGPWVWHEVPTEDGGFYSVLYAENGPPFCKEVILPVPGEDDEATISVWNPKDAEAIAAIPETVARIASLEAEVERLKAGYHDCLEDLICCGCQLDDYFQQKYGLDAAVKKHTEALEGDPHAP